MGEVNVRSYYGRPPVSKEVSIRWALCSDQHLPGGAYAPRPLPFGPFKESPHGVRF